MRKDVRKCIFTGLLCFWLFAEVIDCNLPVVRIEDRIPKEEEYKSEKERVERKDSDRNKIRIHLKNDQQMDIHIAWIVKGGILILFLSVMKRAD